MVLQSEEAFAKIMRRVQIEGFMTVREQFDFVRFCKKRIRCQQGVVLMTFLTYGLCYSTSVSIDTEISTPNRFYDG